MGISKLLNQYCPNDCKNLNVNEKGRKFCTFFTGKLKLSKDGKLFRNLKCIKAEADK
jgi:hypothetical protein